MSRSVSLAVTGEFVIFICEIYFMLLYMLLYILCLSPLPLSEEGAQYTCQYTASSVYVSNVDATRPPHTITLTCKK